MLKDTDKTIFVGRNADGTIYGLWTCGQWEDQEQLLEDDPEVIAFNAPKPKVKVLTLGSIEELFKKAGISEADIEAAKE